MKITRDLIASRARKGDLRGQLTERLAPYLLGGGLGARHRVEITQPGTALVLVSNLPPTSFPALPSGYLFPVRWCKGQSDDSCLPSQLLETANQVRTALGLEGWGLWRLESHSSFDFSEFAIDGGSGFLPLAAGLLVAERGGRPDPAVFATGSWDPDGRCLKLVDFGGKGEAIRASGLTTTTVFAPEGTKVEGLDDVRLLTSKPGQSLQEALQPLLERLFTPPRADDSVDIWLNYLNQEHMLTSSDRPRLFAQHLGARLAAELKWHGVDGTPIARPRTGGALAIALDTRNLELADLLCAAYQPAALYLLGTDRIDNELRSKLEARWSGATVTWSAPGQRWDQQAADLAAWLRVEQQNGTPCCCDITPGTKAHTWAIAVAAREASVQSYCADQSSLRRAEAGNILLFGRFSLQKLA